LEVFASRVKRTHGFISRIESGARRPPLEDMDTWADALRLSNANRIAFRVEAALAHLPDGVRGEVRAYLMAEGVREQRARRRKPRSEPPPDHDSEMVIDA
jgi:transcriptional regulator with XRE-family HTH domain